MRSTILIAACIFSLRSAAQKDYNKFPNNYNAFINDPSVSWACQYTSKYSFPNIKIEDKTIYRYFIDGQSTGQIKSYIEKDWIVNSEGLTKLYKGKIKEDFYVEVENKHRQDLFKDLNFDSLERISFEEILFIQNHTLLSYLIAASPTTDIITAHGVNLGNIGLSNSSINKDPNFISTKDDSVIFLGKTQDLFQIDSLEEHANIKKTYNMNIALTMWYDLSKVYNQAIDLKRNHIISSKNIMDYSVLDSIEVFHCGDTFPSPPDFKISGEPARLYFSHLGLSRDWYYNKTKNIFFSKINEAFLFTKVYLNQTKEEINKSIKIIF
jgi:hypothetical protein